MLAKYWRLRMKWDGDQTLTYDNAARIAIRLSPWKIASGALSYGAVITDDLGFGAGESIADDAEVEGSINDNTSNLYWGVKGFFKVTADADSTNGTAYLYLEEADESTDDAVYWPSNQENFVCATHLRLVAVLRLDTASTDDAAAVNFEF